MLCQALALCFTNLLSRAEAEGPRRSLAGIQESLLYNFQGAPDAGAPANGAVLKLGSAYYGDGSGGAYGDGAVWRIRRERGVFRDELLYSFSGEDGQYPSGGLIADSSGALYGITLSGGSAGAGVVFKLTPTAGGYQESTLYSLRGYEDGSFGIAVALGADGSVYGTTLFGGNGEGTVIKVTPSGSGYSESVISKLDATTGYHPDAGLVVAADGSLYGTGFSGGTYGAGTVFKVATAGSGYLTTAVYSFQGHYDGAGPASSLLVDRRGTIYGTTEYGGGPSYLGTVFALKPVAAGYRERVLYSFAGGSDGAYPQAGLTFGQKGSILGTTYNGGSSNTGVVFELTPDGSEKYAETVLHAFEDYPADGQYPIAPLLADGGSFYGLTQSGGAANGGTFFVITP